jgi:hypothetical protein
LWVQLGEKSVRRKESFVQTHSAEKSAVGYLLLFGQETFELILRDYVVTWPERKDEWMDKRSSLEIN